MKPLIMIVEDEEDMLELLEYNLKNSDYETIGFTNTKKVEQFLQEEIVNLIIMDRNLPGVEGSEFISKLRKNGISIPVIYLTAKSSYENVEEGFLSGGDDYITKPFNMKEFLLRVGAMLKRTLKNSETVAYRDIIMSLKSREVMIEDKYIELTKLEFDLLKTLIENENVVLDRDFLLENVWNNDIGNQNRTVNVGINRLKEKIDPDKDKNYIKTVRGVGYTVC